MNITPFGEAEEIASQRRLMERARGIPWPEGDVYHYLTGFPLKDPDGLNSKEYISLMQTFTHDSWLKTVERCVQDAYSSFSIHALPGSVHSPETGLIIHRSPNSSFQSQSQAPYHLAIYSYRDLVAQASFSLAPAGLVLWTLANEHEQNYCDRLLEHLGGIARDLNARTLYVQRDLVGINPLDQAGKRHLRIVSKNNAIFGNSPKKPHTLYSLG